MSWRRPAACREWAHVADREALGEPLDEHERALLRDHPVRCPTCAAEAQVWESFEGLLERSGQAPAVTLQARSRSRARRGLTAFAWAAACLLGAVVAVQQGRRADAPQAAQPVSKAGTELAMPTARIQRGVGAFTIDERQAATGQDVQVGARIATKQGVVCLRIDPHIRACLDEHSVLRVVELSAAARRLELLHGRVAAELEPQPAGSRFAIDTPAGSATAVGTAFSVEVPPEGGAVVTRVTHGVVLVRGKRGTELRVMAQRRAVMDGAIGALEPADAERDHTLMEHARPDARQTEEVGQQTEPEAAGMQLDTPETGSVEPSDEPAPTWLREQAEPAGTQAATAERHRVTSGDARERAPARLLSLAREARARGALGEAAAAYRALFERHDGSREAQAARVAYGQLLLSAFADPSGALTAFERYLERGGGPLVEEAEYGRIRALQKLARTDDERSAIASFLRGHPDSSLAASLRQRAEALGAD